jgi:hypothetical protein
MLNKIYRIRKKWIRNKLKYLFETDTSFCPETYRDYIQYDITEMENQKKRVYQFC